MLTEFGARYALAGHSGRRSAGEAGESVNARVHAAIRKHITPIVCVGEELDVGRAGRHVDHTVSQVEEALGHVAATDVAGLLIAYEPVWAIGTGEVATPTDAQEVCAAIRGKIADLYDTDTAEQARILYGGSVSRPPAPISSPNATSTAPWSAAPASTPTSCSPSGEQPPPHPRSDLTRPGPADTHRPSPTERNHSHDRTRPEHATMPVIGRLAPNATRDEVIAHVAEAARQIRIQDLKLVHYAGAGHIGGDFSAIDILATLYGAVLNVTPETVDDPERDRFILSKGHVAGALYTTLAAFGFLAGRASWPPSSSRCRG